VQQALAVLARNRVLGLRQIEHHRAIFDHDRTRGLDQELLQRSGKGLGIHAAIVLNRRDQSL
jgi:hypothetical protein